MAPAEDPATRRECFVIAPIGNPGSDIRRRSDQILNHVIRPVVEPRGYFAVRGDEIDRAGLITTQVIDRIINSHLVIADLTDQNPNVFYELAVRHALHLPFVQMIAVDQQLPFDVQGMRTIPVNHTDLDSVAAAKELLGRAIDAIGDESVEVTPISVTLTLQDLRVSSHRGEGGLSEIAELLPQILEQLRDLRRGLREVRGTQQDLGEALHDLRRDVNPVPLDHTARDEDGHRQLRRLVENLTDRGALTEQDLQNLLTGEVGNKFERWVSDLVARLARATGRGPI